MATTLSVKWPTLIDVASRMDPNGSVSAIAEVLNETNEIIQDVPMVEGNLPTGHELSRRTSMPTVTFRLFNSGVAQSKSTATKTTEVTGSLESYAEIDKDIADLNGNAAEFRLSESRAFLEAMAQTYVDTLLYGDTSVYPERFLGLAPRYSALTGLTGSANVISAGESATLTSVWLVGWSPETIFGIYPKGSSAGLQQSDKGQVTLLDTSGNAYEGYRTHYQWKCGLAVKDWRFAVRIANINSATLLTAGDTSDTSVNLLKLMARALGRLPYRSTRVSPIFYMNETSQTMLFVKAMNKAAAGLDIRDLLGPAGLTIPTLHYLGVPVKRCDAITNAETIVS
jgi:hypothetical protein